MIRKLNESSVARKAYKNLTSAIDIIYNASCPLSPLSSSSKKRSGETDAFKQWPLLERSEIFFSILLHNPKILSQKVRSSPLRW